MFGILGIMAVLLAAGFVAVADDSSAATTFDLSADGDDYVKVSGDLKYTLTYDIDSNLSFTATLTDSDGDTAGSVSPSSGTLYASSTSRAFTVTAPSTAGDYTLKVTVTETVDEEEVTYERTAFLRAVDPITLSVTVENEGDAARSFIAYFYIQDGDEWTKLDDSKQTVKVEANASQTVTYDYIVRDVETTTFCLQADDDAVIGGAISGLGTDNAHTYYTEENDYRVIEYICIAVLIVLLVIAIWIYRKPVKNRGKPKARR